LSTPTTPVPLRQLVGDDAGGSHFLEADFRMRVKIAPDRGEFVGETFDAFDVGHLFIRWRLSVIWRE
jgi:hypothetical protein